MYYAVAMCQVQPGIKRKRICYGSLKIILMVITIAGSLFLLPHSPSLLPVAAPVPQGRTTPPLEPFPGTRRKAGFRPQLLKVVGVSLSAVIGLRFSPTVDTTSEAAISF